MSAATFARSCVCGIAIWALAYLWVRLILG